MTEPLFVIAGPCVVESEQLCMDVAGTVAEITRRLGIPYIFKASYRKANRSSLNSFTGIGDEAGLEIIKKVGHTIGLQVLTDIHSASDAELAARYVDVLQIPAFLCRQTDLLEAAGRTNLTVNIKKGQFLSAEAMQFVAEKVAATGNKKILLTERGTTFGYQDLVVDFRGIPVMRALGYPVVMDCTHSLQQPNQPAGVTGGRPNLIETMAKCAVAAGVDGLFIETHPNPAEAKSDGANMLKLDKLEGLIEKVVKLKQSL